MARKINAADTIVIENTRPCAVFLPPVLDDKGAQRLPQKMLMPGQNDVSAEHFKALGGNPAIRMYVKLGYLVDRGAGKAKPLPSGLDGLSDAAATEKLAQIDDPRLLQDLRDRTASGALRDLAQERLRELIEADHTDAGTPDA